MKQKIKIIVSGGGTGGHIYPAISIANALKQKHQDCEILFVGAEGKMEMEKVPAAGYDIVGLPIRGLQRSFSKENLKFFARLLKSIWKAKAIVKGFKPDAVVGVGGYASGPLLHVAAKLGVPALIQEQNSYAGITNKLLAKKAKKICVAYEGMERFFPKEKIVMTGNPVRKDLLEIESKREEALKHFDLKSDKKTILIVGGSLGARTINNSVLNSLEAISQSGVQVIWQTGKFYIEKVKTELDNWDLPNLKVTDFLSRMDLAYAAADIVISRAGAGTISELCLVEKACILVPSPNVSEDHQTKNAMALVNKDAAVMVKDIEAEENLIPQALELIDDKEKCARLAKNCKLLAKPDAADDIAEHILAMI
ncbi:undecaprenyldiphospho-muramoylpentapeptide beta-N-acetylglucosaminyltransferase [Marinifilum fragile]|uniref:undecaprenyldiphospho-muramoylpentapeptide beta-N-acetylglucosaminyltransferase n=1 Tax=Marinifilum fragile TaxID=570161 RepID=UPI002AA960DD|nr:undecaprenyldiphospho-muramoylpentapeptide beta-N-acetylglucosaminyltransferase [Marinifilum fragile]